MVEKKIELYPSTSPYKGFYFVWQVWRMVG